MIRVGWLPVLWRARRRGANYVRVRRRAPRRSPRRAPSTPVAVPSGFIDDFGAAPVSHLPTATLVRGAGAASTLLGSVRGWLALQATWLKPRAIPMVVAFAGMLGVLASVNYLSAMNLAGRAKGAGPAHVTSRGATKSPAEGPTRMRWHGE